VWQPLTGWLGHNAPFAFDPEYRPAPGIQQYQCGTPPVIALAALEAALDVFDTAQQLGGMAAIRAKSLALTEATMQKMVVNTGTAHTTTMPTREMASRMAASVQVSWKFSDSLAGSDTQADSSFLIR
jgi:kynureninase